MKRTIPYALSYALAFHVVAFAQPVSPDAVDGPTQSSRFDAEVAPLDATRGTPDAANSPLRGGNGATDRRLVLRIVGSIGYFATGDLDMLRRSEGVGELFRYSYLGYGIEWADDGYGYTYYDGWEAQPSRGARLEIGIEAELRLAPDLALGLSSSAVVLPKAIDAGVAYFRLTDGSTHVGTFDRPSGFGVVLDASLRFSVRATRLFVGLGGRFGGLWFPGDLSYRDSSGSVSISQVAHGRTVGGMFEIGLYAGPRRDIVIAVREVCGAPLSSTELRVGVPIFRTSR